MNLSEAQLKIIKNVWHWPGTFEELCDLIASYIAEAEDKLAPKSSSVVNKSYWETEFKEILVNRLFFPNTPTWANAGREWKGSLSACFVYNIQDSMESILDSSRWMGMVQKFGGGTGFDLSELRPRGDRINSTHGKACGPIAVLKYLAATSQMVTQGGIRDGANMAVLSVYHKDLMSFINLKAQESKYMLEIPYEIAQNKINSNEWTVNEAKNYIEYCKLNGLYQLFNVSVAVSDDFMYRISNYRSMIESGETEKEAIKSSKVDELLPCGQSYKDVFDAIVSQAHKSGDPGLLFIDRIRDSAATQTILPVNATNPCGEQALPHNGSCNLGSIDLSKFVKDSYILTEVPPKEKYWEEAFDWDKFKHVIHVAVRFLDNVVEINTHADPGISDVNRLERRIGLGIMGWADLLVKFGVSYTSKDAIKILESIGEFFSIEAHKASVLLAEERGAFPLYDSVEKITSSGIQPFPNSPRRNATVTTIAPTGTISIVAGCSSGIEPHFDLVFTHAGLKDSGGIGVTWASETVKELAENVIGIESLTIESIEKIKSIFKDTWNWKPANAIPINWHILHQAGWQRYIDNSISKTLNLPNSATVEDVAITYIMAWLEGCKGSTIYRDGSKPFQVLNSIKDDSSKETSMTTTTTNILEHQSPRKTSRPRWVTSETAKIETAEGDLYITITHDDRGMPFEIFANLGKGGTSTAAAVEAMNRIISTGLRYGIPPFEYIKQLRGIKSIQHGFGPSAVFSVPDAIGQVLEEYMINTFGDDWAIDYGWSPQKNGNEYVPQISQTNPNIEELCPNCGNQLYFSEGCRGGTCPVCGHSKCN